MSYIITGANGGLGFESAVLLAKHIDAQDDEAGKIIITTRSQAKADDAIERLAVATGRPAAFFSSLILDINNVDECRAAAAAVPAQVQGVILNAGGWGTNDVLPSGVIDAFSKNVFGHVVLVEELFALNKLGAGARLVLAGSFAALGSMGIPRPQMKDIADSREWATFMDGTGYEKFDQGACYAYTKLIGALYMGKLAREHPEVYSVTISPGACTDTNGHTQAEGCSKALIPFTLKLMKFFGRAQSPQDGARRFVQGVTGDDFPFASGTFVGSIKGMTGPVGDQADHWDIFANHDAQDAATAAIRSFMAEA